MNLAQLRNFPRVEQEELLDLGQGTPREVMENLREMQRINDLLGGTRALTQHLLPRLLIQNGPVSVADLGAGGAGLPKWLSDWADILDLNIQILAVDWSIRNLQAARSHLGPATNIHLLRADAMCLPLPPNSVDFVISSLFLHHLNPDQLVRVLQQSWEAARQGIIMSDLIRGWMPYLSFKLIQPVFAQNYLTRHDGALSVKRAYLPGELHRFAIWAGLPNPQVFTHFPWRMTLVVEK